MKRRNNKATTTDSLRRRNKRLAEDVVTNVGQEPVRYQCPFWHHKEMISRIACFSSSLKSGASKTNKRLTFLISGEISDRMEAHIIVRKYWFDWILYNMGCYVQIFVVRFSLPLNMWHGFILGIRSFLSLVGRSDRLRRWDAYPQFSPSSLRTTKECITHIHLA